VGCGDWKGKFQGREVERAEAGGLEGRVKVRETTERDVVVMLS